MRTYTERCINKFSEISLPGREQQVYSGSGGFHKSAMAIDIKTYLGISNLKRIMALIIHVTTNWRVKVKMELKKLTGEVGAYYF